MYSRRRGLVLALALLSLTAAVSCVRQATTPLPPPRATGNPIVGINPNVGSTPNARTDTVQYGPYTVPAATGAGHGQSGMIRNAIAFAVKRPCGDCYITGIRPSLSHRDGRVANVDTGMWLHHIVLATFGRRDPTCGDGPPQILGERFFASGNERSQAHFPAGTGLPVGALDSWTLVYDLMNTNMTPEDVTVDVTFDWVPASTPGMRALKPVWLDAAPTCGGAPLPARTGKYTYSGSWTVNVPGRVIGIGGHLHDGGTVLRVRNDRTSTNICDSTAAYGGPGFEEPEGAGGHEHGNGSPPTTDGHGHTNGDHARMHLSSMTQCMARALDHPVAVLRTGEQISLVAHYDGDLHPHDSHPVMGISIMYVLP